MSGVKCKAHDLTRLPSQTASSRWQVDKEAIGLWRVQQFSHLCLARPWAHEKTQSRLHIIKASKYEIAKRARPT